MNDQILLLIDHRRNHDLLAEWLSQRYTILQPDLQEPLGQPFDLAIVDGTAVDRLAAQLHQCKQANEPIFQPVLFLTNRQDIGVATRHLWHSIDEILMMPIEKVELVARVEILLRARRMSSEVTAANRQMWTVLNTLQQSEQALVSANQRYDLATQVVGGIVYEWDIAGNSIEFSRSLSEILGIQDRKFVPYQGWWNGHTHPEDLAHLRHEIEAALSSSSGYELEYRMVRTSGEVLNMWDRGVIVRSLDGNAVRVIGCVLDITPRKRSEQERADLLNRERIARLEAERANEVKIHFLAMISHELRTPLTSIKGFATTMLAEDVEWTPSETREYAGIINDEATKMQALIEQLLDLSRLNAGTFVAEERMVTLSEICAPIAAELNALTANHILVIDFPDDLPLVNVDPTRIGQVLVNLIGNAAKFSPPNTPIRCMACARAGSVQIEIRDEGIGIQPADRTTVFEAFRQVNLSGKGAGLGLAICKGIIEANHGTIWIADHPGPGTLMCFTLPTV